MVPTENIAGHMDRICNTVAEGISSVLEIGVEYGTGSTQAIRSGFEKNIDKEHKYQKLWVSVDIVRQIHPWLTPRWPWWYFIEGDSCNPETAKRVKPLLSTSCKEGFEMIFIDTIHTQEHLARELKVWSPLANPTRCVWLFHDTWMYGVYNPMTDAIKEFAARSQYWRFEELSKESHGISGLFPELKKKREE